LLFILPTNLDEEAATGTTERVRSYVTSRGGEVMSLEPWGRRRLAFPIMRNRDGMYHIARIALGPEQTVDLDRALRLNEQVLRHMIVKLD
jgi:small subunit ribosomal protein S6